MPDDRHRRPVLYTQIDVSHGTYAPPAGGQSAGTAEIIGLLRELLAAQDRQNELLEELIAQVGAAQRQRAAELNQWKQANPALAAACRSAAEALSKIQTEYLVSITQEINENFEQLRDGEFMLNEFVDRFGPRLAHLNGLLQVLSQLSSTPNPASSSGPP